MPEPTVIGVEFDGNFRLLFKMSDGMDAVVRVPKEVAAFIHERLVGYPPPEAPRGSWTWTKVRRE